MSTWVQHKSRIGEKWELSDDQSPCDRGEWRVESKEVRGAYLYLPQSEYIECSPPEEWQDVTEECDWGNAGEGMEAIIFHQGLRLLADRGYRLRKIKDMYNISYFIVERRKS